MSISSIGPAVTSPFPGKSKDVPAGLQRRELDLPPGIAKKIEAGGTAPRGIVNRFPAAAPVTETPSEPVADGAGVEGTSTVDIVV